MAVRLTDEDRARLRQILGMQGQYHAAPPEEERDLYPAPFEDEGLGTVPGGGIGLISRRFVEGDGGMPVFGGGERLPPLRSAPDRQLEPLTLPGGPPSVPLDGDGGPLGAEGIEGEPGVAGGAPESTIFSRFVGGIGNALTGGGGGAKPTGVADAIAGTDEEEETRVVARGTQADVEAQLKEQGLSPENANLMIVKDNETGEVQAIQVPRVGPRSDEQLREDRYRDAFEATQFEIKRRNEQIARDINKLESIHASVLQDLDKGMRLAIDPEERSIYVRAKAAARQNFMQGMSAKQAERNQINLLGTQLVSEFARDRQRGSYIPFDEFEKRENVKLQNQLLAKQADHQLRLERLSKEYGLRLDDLMRDTKIDRIQKEGAEYLRRALDPMTRSSLKQAYLERYNALDAELVEYLRGMQTGGGGQAGSSGANSARTGGGSSGGGAAGPRLIENPDGSLDVEGDWQKLSEDQRRRLLEYQRGRAKR